MSRSFVRANPDALYVNSAPVVVQPLTVSGLVWLTDLEGGDYHYLFMLRDSGGSEFFAIRIDPTGELTALIGYDGGSIRYATTSNVVTVNTWHHYCGIFLPTNDPGHIAILDGDLANKGTYGFTRVVDNIDTTILGSTSPTGGTHSLNGRLAECGIRNVALTDTEVVSQSKRYSQSFVRPANLAFHTPLIRDEDEDLVGGLSLTAFGEPGIAAHPRIIYPAPKVYSFPAAVAPPSGKLLMRMQAEGLYVGQVA